MEDSILFIEIKDKNMLPTKEARSTRERVLKTLLNHERSTINGLAEAVNINPISVRHHISKLEAEGFVISEEEHYGVGRPRRVYYLTEKGREYFPTRYINLTLRLLEQLKETMPQPMVNKLFTQIAKDIAADYRTEIENLSSEERLNLVGRLLTQEGFNVEIERQGNYYLIRELNCPYYHLGQTHPEVCTVDQTLISTVLDIPVQKIKCMLQGDAHCTFVIPRQFDTFDESDLPDNHEPE